MNKRNLLVLVCATLATFVGISVFAGPPKTLFCNQTVTFPALDCNGTAHLDCGPGGALLYYNMQGCMFYTYENDPYHTQVIGQAVGLQLNTVYQAKLTRTPDYNGNGTKLTIDTHYGQPAPQPLPVPPSNDTHQLRSPYNYPSAQDVFMNGNEAQLHACGANGGVKAIRGINGSAFALIRGSTQCSRVDIFDQFENYTGRTVHLQFNGGEIPLDGVSGTVILKLHSESQETGELFYVHVN